MRQRKRQIVPLQIVANHCCSVLDAVYPFGGVNALGGIEDVSGDDVDRHAVTVGVVDGHGSMLNSNSAVSEDGERLAFNLRVSVGHGDGGFFMTASDELGILVATIVDHGFMKASEGRARISAHVLDAERLDDVDHVVRASAICHKNFKGSG